MKIFKSRLVLGTLCVGAALLICFGIAPQFSAVAARMVDVVRLRGDVSAGQEIKASDIEVVAAGSQNLPEVAQKTDDVLGKYAAFDMLAGEFVMMKKLRNTPANENAYLHELTGEKQAISISVADFAESLSGKLQPGDIISVYAPGQGQDDETRQPDELRFVEVIAATHQSGYDVGDESGTEYTPDGDAEKMLPATITVLARSEQALLLAELEAKGRLHVSLVYRGVQDKAKEFLDKQDEILNKMEKNPVRSLTEGDNEN